MTDANQVRINELARELEVKAKAIIDLLPGFGVTEKKTHSSSIPVDVAEKVRKQIQGVAEAEAQVEAAARAKAAAVAAARAAAAPTSVTSTSEPGPGADSGDSKDEGAEHHSSEDRKSTRLTPVTL